MKKILFLLVGVVFCGLIVTAPGFAETVTVKSGKNVNIPKTLGNTNVVVQVQPEVITPIKTSQCLDETPSGDCHRVEFTYSALGMSCTEDCLAFDTFDKCVLHNNCSFDQGSKMFVKAVCVDIDDFNDCRKWDAEPQD